MVRAQRLQVAARLRTDPGDHFGGGKALQHPPLEPGGVADEIRASGVGPDWHVDRHVANIVVAVLAERLV
jgi:hypothetical protein